MAERTAAGVVIVGAGVIGASVAWHLVARGVRDVVLLDGSAGPGSGSTGAATGGFRAQFATGINVRLSLLSRAKLLRFRDEIGADPGFVQAGYLWLAESSEQLDALRAARAVQHACGLHESIEAGVGDIARLQPAVVTEGILGGAFCPTDGFIKPRAILQGYLAAAERGGARIAWGEAVSGFELDGGGRIVAVRTNTRSIPCGSVVNAAGAWAGPVARLAGTTLPVTPLRRHLAPTVPTTVLPPEAPMTLYCGDGFHFRERDGRALLGWPTPGREGAPFDTSVDPSTLAGIEARKVARVRALRGVPLDSSAAWTGLYEMSPDKHAILGPSPERANFYFINGSSGHGVMHAPALGQLLAEILTEGRAASLDATPLGPDRFASGRSLPASEVL
jgi:sarcosine oxidase, subunit beta